MKSIELIERLPRMADSLLAAISDKWWARSERCTYSGSAHREAEDILVRYNPRPLGVHTMDELDTVDYPALEALGEPLQRFMGIFPKPLGRIILSRLPAGKVIHPHIDEGAYARAHSRYHLVLQGHCTLRSGDYTADMQTGDLWWFDTQQEHAVVNNGDRDRVAIIVDVRNAL